MKLIFSVGVLLMLLSSHAAIAQSKINWLAASPVADKTYGNLHPRIKLDGNNNPFVLWGSEGGKAYIAKWGGEGFAAPVEMSPPGKQVFTSSWAGPDLAVSGNNVYVTYKLLPEETGHIYVVHSYDGGQSYSIPIEADDKRIEDHDYITRYPIITTNETGQPYIAFMKTDPEYEQHTYWVARSEDMGESFSKATLGSVNTGNRVCDCSPASMIVSGSAGVIVYRNHYGLNRNIGAGVSNNGCVSFGLGMRLDSTYFAPENCVGSGTGSALLGDTVYSVFMSGEGAAGTIFISKLSISSNTNVTTTLANKPVGVEIQNHPRIAADQNALAAVWTQIAAGNNQVCLSFTDDLAKGLPKRYDTVATGVMLDADIAMGGGYIYIVWEDQVTKTVMFRRGQYMKKSTIKQATNIIIAQPPKGQKYFLINLPGIETCTLVDPKGNSYDTDVSYPKGKGVCQVTIDDIFPGTYSVRIWDKDGKIYNGQVEVK